MSKPIWDTKSSGNFDTDFDCFIAEALLSEGRHVGTLDETLSRYHVTTIEALADKQKEKFLTYPKLYSLFTDIEMPLAKVLWLMEQRGILLDTQQLTKVGQDIDTALEEVNKNIEKETGGGLNINSSMQLGSFLAEKVGIPLGKTKTGKYATNEGELSKYTEQFPIIADLLSYRELTKLRSTYVESLIQKADEKGRVHTTYHQMYVNTGRLASSNPNLQNIPVTSKIGLEIKSCFIASPGFTFVSFDYSQQELRILAHLTSEPALQKAFEEKLDVHIVTAGKLFDTPYQQVTKEQRAVGKTINFGIIYGMSSYGMSAGLHIPQEDAEHFIRQFYASYPKIKTFYDSYLKTAHINGVAETLLGRRRYVFENPKRRFIDNGMRRVLMNYPIQGTAADLTKKAMVDVYNLISKQFPDVSLLLQIHDDLVFEIPDDKNQTQTIKTIQKVLCTVYPLSVPMEVEIKIGKQWGNMQPLHNG
ncbi:MAG TPA: DNA polymerase [Candidatus Acidoferrales bacterium]|nr:DNA polymerase [Candidatus Acidoferrales bacterium]